MNTPGSVTLQDVDGEAFVVLFEGFGLSEASLPLSRLLMASYNPMAPWDSCITSPRAIPDRSVVGNRFKYDNSRVLDAGSWFITVRASSTPICRVRSMAERTPVSSRRGGTNGRSQTRKAWLEGLQSWDDAAVHSPKVLRIFQLLEECWARYPKFLDTLNEGTARGTRIRPGLKPLFITGEVEDKDRMLNLHRFHDQSETHSPILITAGAGGAALNLQVASIVILIEPWWCDGARLQAIFRAKQPMQVREVEVFPYYMHEFGRRPAHFAHREAQRSNHG
ncbi:hypothetical protein B0T22DRAFT_532129 [Podospora appendiculata]|uniref:Helicase C-terminal domain-containing protein n=1 Tax=Podospora appendiculata TaxID=314037 RepID=A0AAE1CFW4_9PEZI|nr:hypothetical protein B0T22DRAFT_532129 [Podospora appendiculata]